MLTHSLIVNDSGFSVIELLAFVVVVFSDLPAVAKGVIILSSSRNRGSDLPQSQLLAQLVEDLWASHREFGLDLAPDVLLKLMGVLKSFEEVDIRVATAVAALGRDVNDQFVNFGSDGDF